MRLAGVDATRSNPETDSEDAREGDGDRAGRVTFPAKFGDLVSSGLIRAGETLYLKQGRTEARGSVTADGEIVVRGVAYKSPSSAAASALGLQSSNGWITWRVGALDGPTLDSLRQQWLAKQNSDPQP